MLATVTSTFDPDGDSVELNYDWRRHGQSIAQLNMSFDTQIYVVLQITLHFKIMAPYMVLHHMHWNQRKCHVLMAPVVISKLKMQIFFQILAFRCGSKQVSIVQSIISQSLNTTNVNEHFCSLESIANSSFNLPFSSNQWMTQAHSTVLSADWT